MPRARREYVSCFSGCVDDDEEGADKIDVGYSRLDSKSDRVTLVHSDGRRDTTDHADDDNEYFRSADSYQWNPADADQGQQEERERGEGDGKRTDDQGSHNYTGIDIHGPPKKKIKRKSMRSRIQHILHSSWKWFKRGFIFIAPAMTSGLTFNPASSYIVSDRARQIAAAQAEKRANKVNL